MDIYFLGRAVKSVGADHPHPQRWIWISLSLTFATLYSLVALKTAFSAEYVVNDDARQHVFWMRQYLDPDLFPNDAIVEYFKSISPWGYTAFYQFWMNLGIDPIWLHKVLPLGLTLVTTIYCYGVTVEILPIPAAGFVASLLFNQLIWAEDTVASGTSRAFVYPLLLAALYYLLRRSWLLCWGAIALMAAIYPSGTLVVAGILALRLVHWDDRGIRLSNHWADYVGCLGGIAIIVIGLLPELLHPSPYGPLITVEQARQMPEFGVEGRTEFFNPNPWRFWIDSSRSGINPPAFPPTVWASVLLPWLWRRPQTFPVMHQMTAQRWILPQVLLVSGAWFVLAHLLLFRLYLPNRYINFSGRGVMAIAAGIVLVALLDAMLRRIAARTLKPWTVYGAIALVILMPLANGRFGERGYVQGMEPAIYEFFQQQPKDIMIASLALEARSVPTFAQRSILISREHAIPYHLGYYLPFRQKIFDTLNAQYTTDAATLQRFTETYGIDYWLLEQTAFGPNYLSHNWVRQYDGRVDQISQQLLGGDRPVLEQAMARCRVIEGVEMRVIDAACAIALPPNDSPSPSRGIPGSNMTPSSSSRLPGG